MSNLAQGLPIRSSGALPAVPDMVNLGVNDLTPQFALGMKIQDAFGNSYMYVKYGYTSAQGDAVSINWTNTANTGGNWTVIQPTTATLSNFFGIAMNIVTSGNYGFVQIAGWNAVPLASTTITAGDFLKLANASSAFVNDVAQGTNPSFLWGAATTTSYAAAAPAVGTVYIYGLAAGLSL